MSLIVRVVPLSSKLQLYKQYSHLPSNPTDSIVSYLLEVTYSCMYNTYIFLLVESLPQGFYTLELIELNNL